MIKKNVKFILPVVVLIMLVSVLLVIYLIPGSVIVPDVVGQGYNEASNELAEIGLKIDIIYNYSFTVPKDKIISQNIATGTEIDKNSIVSVVVSKGIEQVVVPDLTGKSLELATSQLSALELNIECTEEEYSFDILKGSIISQNISSQSKIDKRSTVNVVVSKGVEQVAVPNLDGKTFNEAKKILSDIGLNLAETNEITFSNTIPEDNIISQDITPGKMIDKKSTISVTVSYGKANTIGNTAANLSYNGNATAQGNWVYFLTDFGEIYKYNTKTNKKVRIYSHASTDWGLHQINVIGEWVYFYAANEGIFKVRIDGTGVQKISNLQGLFMYMCVSDGYIYYYSDYSENSGYRLYRMKVDGSSRKKISDDHCNQINIVGDYIYYYSEYTDMTKSCFYKMKRDGSGKTLISTEYHNYLYIDGNNVYIANGRMLLCKSNMSNIMQLSSLNIHGTLINASGNRICYIDTVNSDIYSVKNDGTGIMRLAPCSSYGYNVVGDWIFYESNRYEISKMKLDGSEKSVVHKG